MNDRTTPAPDDAGAPVTSSVADVRGVPLSRVAESFDTSRIVGKPATRVPVAAFNASL